MTGDAPAACLDRDHVGGGRPALPTGYHSEEQPGTRTSSPLRPQRAPNPPLLPTNCPPLIAATRVERKPTFGLQSAGVNCSSVPTTVANTRKNSPPLRRAGTTSQRDSLLTADNEAATDSR